VTRAERRRDASERQRLTSKLLCAGFMAPGARNVALSRQVHPLAAKRIPSHGGFGGFGARKRRFRRCLPFRESRTAPNKCIRAPNERI
jgi:hypothetical protein